MVALLVHTPPPDASLSIVDRPKHPILLPAIGAGKGFTVNTVVIGHPPAIYVIVTVPATSPVTIPELSPIAALKGLLLVHVPPVSASESFTERPAQTFVVPVIAGGSAGRYSCNNTCASAYRSNSSISAVPCAAQ